MPTINLLLPKRTPPQKRIHDSKSRFNLAIWGRQSGKTTFGIQKLAYKPLESPKNRVYWHILQTHDAADIAFKRYVNLFPREAKKYLFEKKPNESDKTVFLTGNRQVTFKSGQNFEDLRAETLGGCVIDEYRQQNPMLWTSVIRPMLAKTKGWCDILSTANGFDHVFDLYTEMKLNPEWSVFHAPSSEAWWWTEEEILSAKRSMTEDEFAQEIMAEFRNFRQGLVYISHGDHNKRSSNPFWADGPFHPMLPIIVAMDFNLSPMAWTLGQRKNESFHFFDEVWQKNTHTQQHAELLAQKIIELNPRQGIIIAGDSTSKAGQRAACGQSDYDIIGQTLDRYKIKWTNETPDSNPPIKDRINTMNAKLKSATGEVHLTYDPINCPRLKKDFERVCWKEGNNLIEDQVSDKDLTHSSSGVGYAVHALCPLKYNQSVPQLKVHHRSW